jgi:hypothetical protein
MKMMMYPEIHTLADDNLHWSGVEAQASPNATKAHRNLLELSTNMEDPSHYGTLENGHLTCTNMGKPPQLNWRLSINPQSLRQTLQLNWRLPRIATKSPQSLERSLQLN